MSEFSGKCDFCDEIEIYGLDRILNSKIYIEGREKPLKLTCLADCVPYYPYVVVASCDLNFNLTIWLTSKSWVDIEEDRYGHFGCHDSYRQKLKEEIERINKK